MYVTGRTLLLEVVFISISIYFLCGTTLTTFSPWKKNLKFFFDFLNARITGKTVRYDSSSLLLHSNHKSLLNSIVPFYRSLSSKKAKKSENPSKTEENQKKSVKNRAKARFFTLFFIFFLILYNEKVFWREKLVFPPKKKFFPLFAF